MRLDFMSNILTTIKILKKRERENLATETSREKKHSNTGTVIKNPLFKSSIQNPKDKNRNPLRGKRDTN